MGDWILYSFRLPFMAVFPPFLRVSAFLLASVCGVEGERPQRLVRKSIFVRGVLCGDSKPCGEVDVPMGVALYLGVRMFDSILDFASQVKGSEIHTHDIRQRIPVV